ncbi:hypothetical protein KC19_5G001200 [Ceratodon purpureus]|uniref:Uncharacterized protein n=1 Tax=Ceratodon purpureus TaxID=3225 RepID=A0A8T0HXL1_CERPU|nr:hypothetical protein KC19_5G001200 [Ceratodon purpureus]
MAKSTRLTRSSIMRLRSCVSLSLAALIRAICAKSSAGVGPCGPSSFLAFPFSFPLPFLGPMVALLTRGGAYAAGNGSGGSSKWKGSEGKGSTSKEEGAAVVGDGERGVEERRSRNEWGCKWKEAMQGKGEGKAGREGVGREGRGEGGRGRTNE